MDHSVKCTCCGEEVDISYERSRMLRWLHENQFIHNSHYLQIVDELGLPDPQKDRLEKQNELTQKLFIIQEEIMKADDQDVIEKLEMRKQKIDEQLRNNF